MTRNVQSYLPRTGNGAGQICLMCSEPNGSCDHGLSTMGALFR